MADFSDEEISEDGAFNSEDEKMYGSSVPLRRDDGDAHDDAESEGDNEYDDDDGDAETGGTLLSDMLGGDDEGDVASGGGGGRKHKQLLSALDRLDDADESGHTTRRQRQRRQERSETRTESEFNGGDDKTGGSVSMEALMAPLRNKSGLGSLSKQLGSLQRGPSAEKPVDAIMEARASRKLAYTEVGKDVGKWQPMVKANREATTLSFNKDMPRDRLSHSALVGKFAPRTELERGVQQMLDAADAGQRVGRRNASGGGVKASGLWGSDDFGSAGSGDDDAGGRGGASDSSDDELGAGTGALAALRSRLSFTAAAQKRAKKIKSKAYHKIRKRQERRQLQKAEEDACAADPDLARHLEEARAAKRAEERMTLKHKNTSKWAKHTLRATKHTDQALRASNQAALAEQLRLGEQLRRRAGGEDSDDSNDSDDGGTDTVTRSTARARRDALALMRELDEGEGGNAADEGDGKGVMAMAFMKRALAKQRQEAKDNVQQLLRELDDADGHAKEQRYTDEQEAWDDEDDGNDDNHDAEDEDEGEGEGDEDDGQSSRAQARKSETAAEAEAAVRKQLSHNGGSLRMERASQSAGVDSAITVPIASTTASDADSAGANPWLDVAGANGDEDGGKRKSKRRRKQQQEEEGSAVQAKSAAILPAVTTHSFAQQSQDDARDAEESKGKDKDKDKGKSKGVLPGAREEDDKQKELMRRAFADDEGDAERRFAEDKEAQVQEEMERAEGKKRERAPEVADGWGSWAGDGIVVSPRKKARDAKAQRQQKKLEQEARRKRADHGKGKVVVGERRNKKATKYKAEQVPYPFTSREQYERSLRHPLGREWNTVKVTGALNAPEVCTNGGIIDPARLTKAAKRGKTAKRSKQSRSKK